MKKDEKIKESEKKKIEFYGHLRLYGLYDSPLIDELKADIIKLLEKYGVKEHVKRIVVKLE